MSAERNGEEDGIFLSMADMLTLLCFVFISVSLLAPRLRETWQTTDLPRVARTGGVVKDGLTARWADDEGRSGGRERCALQLTEQKGDVSRTLSYQVNCWPHAFNPEQQIDPVLKSFAAERAPTDGPPPTVSILCHRQHFEACTRLHWVLADHGFAAQAAVVADR